MEMNRTLTCSRRLRVARDYWEAFESWGFMVQLDCDSDGVPRLVVSKK